MSAALRPSEIPPALLLRAKALPINVEHIRSTTRKEGRARSREAIVQPALRETRADSTDVADALVVNERAARRSISGEDPFDFGDALCIAKSGLGGVRLARRLAARLSAEIDRIENELLAHD